MSAGNPTAVPTVGPEAFAESDADAFPAPAGFAESFVVVDLSGVAERLDDLMRRCREDRHELAYADLCWVKGDQ